jgi:hypothetical protein
MRDLPPILAQMWADVDRILADYAVLNSLAAPQAEKLAYGARMLGEQASVLREECDAYFARWATPRPALAADGVHPLLDVSTAHITRRDDEILRGWWAALEPVHAPRAAPYRTIAHAYGYFVHVRLDGPEDRAEYEAEAREAGISEAFMALQAYARSHGCWWINLDRDADTIEALPTHDWEAKHEASTLALR